MSGPLKNWTDGEGIVTPELQRAADAAAAADDLILRALVPPGAAGASTYGKRVLPLVEETASVNPRQLVYPSGTAGKAKVRPFQLIVGAKDIVAPDVADVILAGARLTEFESTVFGNTSANNRCDVLYALIQRSGTTASRKVKDPTTGIVSTQSITIYKDVAISFGIQVGSEGGGAPVPSLPSDTSTAWYVALAEVRLAHPFVGGALTHGYALGGAGTGRIAQVWPGSWIADQRLRRHQGFTSVVNSSGVVASATQTTERSGAGARCVFTIRQVTGSANYYKLDTTRDWRGRLVRARVVKLTPAGTAPHAVTAAGAPTSDLDTGSRMTGTDGADFWTSGGSPTPIYLRANSSTGALEIKFDNAGAPDEWVIDIEATDQFLG
jgi:hypothetical protein